MFAGIYMKLLLFLFPLLSEIFVHMVALETKSPKLFVKGNEIAPCACDLFPMDEINSSLCQIIREMGIIELVLTVRRSEAFDIAMPKRDKKASYFLISQSLSIFASYPKLRYSPKYFHHSFELWITDVIRSHHVRIIHFPCSFDCCRILSLKKC